MVCSISGSFIRAFYLKVHEIIKKQAVTKELSDSYNIKWQLRRATESISKKS